MVARITVYEAQISRAFYPGGDVWSNVRRVKMQHYYAAIAFCPTRTGALVNSIYHAQTPVGRFSCRYTIAADTEYVFYVLQGTLAVAPIRPTSGEYMWMRPRPWSHLPFNIKGGTGGRWPFKSVAGQKANDFLGKGLRWTLRANGLVS